MENSDVSPIEIPLPDTCPGCSTGWSEGSCPRCGLTIEDVAGLLERGCAAYAHARAAALSGDFPLARLHLAAVRACGIAVLTEHAAVTRLAELCAYPPPPEMISATTENTVSQTAPPTVSQPSWLIPLTVGGSALGLTAWIVALLALFLAIAALIIALIALLRH